MAEQSNPLLEDWSVNPFGLAPFGKIKAEHFAPAFKTALESHLAEVKVIAENQETPTFENTIIPFDRCGGLLSNISKVFQNLCLSVCLPELQKVQQEMAAPLAAHESKIYMFPGLFNRVDKIYAERLALPLDPEQLRLVERFHLDFVRAGARFDDVKQAQYSAIMEKLAELTTKFAQNTMTDESEVTVELKETELQGCPEDIVEMTKKIASDRKAPTGSYIITLNRSLAVPFLTFATNREAREKVWKAWTSRGELSPDRDNKSVALEILKLRATQAQMHGYKSFSEYQTADSMAQTPQNVLSLLECTWEPAKRCAERERLAMEEFVKQQGEDITIEPWDWRFYAEKLRAAKCNFDESTLKPYLSLDNMVTAVFDCANRLYGLHFVLRPDIEGYHPDVKVYEVRDKTNGDDRVVALFLHDNYFRPHKQSGAWMTDFRSQTRNTPDGSAVIPIIANNNNFARGSNGAPTLLSFDDGITLFHEFGHGLHGMLSNVTYNRLAGTNVLRDFVELPSQLMEHWFSQPEVLRAHARHYQTGEPITGELLNKLISARKFQQGFATVEYTACAIFDQSIHALDSYEGISIDDFEKHEMARLGMPQGIVMRHRPAHFLHLFSASEYAASYYVYQWAEVLDADGFEAFLEAGSCFDTDAAARARKYIYSSGNSIEPGAAYRAFRGRDPNINALLKKKGLDQE